MTTPRYRLTPELQNAICGYILSGGYPHVAAEAAGVPREVFAEWLRQGEDPDGPAHYHALAQAVRQAHAQARLAAEVSIYADRPLDWLMNGPGKETSEAEGWTGTVRPRPVVPEEQSLLCDPRVQQFFADLLEKMGPFPEARAAVAEVVYALPWSAK
jgi:hypothetical protein